MLPKLRRRLLHHLFRFRYFAIGTFVGALILVLLRFTPSVVSFVKNFSLGSSIFWSVVTDRPLTLKEASGRTNILLLGIAGGDYEGATLTDTMIFSSVDLKTNDVTLVSIPRDLWVDSLKGKINSAHEIGEAKRKGGGLVLSKAVVSDTLGQPIHYVVLIDFSGFKKMVDLLGGLDIDVENAFDDYKYPIEGKENDFCDGDQEYLCRFEHLHFNQGLQYMDGEQVLKYARSRQAEGEEGSDFARSRRQQKVIFALKNKILSHETLLNPGKILAARKVLGENIASDIQPEEIDDFLKIAKKINTAQIETLALDTGDEKKGREGLLVNPPLDNYYGAWVLVPRSGDFEEIHKYLESQLSNTTN